VKVRDYLIFFRWKNLLMIILIQLLFKFVLFQKFNLSTSLDYLHFTILILSTLLIAIAGYIINDIHDINTDLINKPNKVFVGKKISIDKANKLFIVFNSLGLLLGFYLSYYIDHNSFFIIYIIISLLLYRYAVDLKRRLIIGNIIVSFVIFLGVFIIVIFDIVPATNLYNNEIQIQVTKIILVYSGFAFILTLVREIVKDMVDIDGDKELYCKTLPIVFGKNKTKIVLTILGIIPLVFLSYYTYLIYKDNVYLSYYLLLFVNIPLLYFIIYIRRSNTKKAFFKLSNLLKIIMLLGIFSILLL
jgi:4-hydroxybenzoate polyprenyltransferase